MSEDTGLLKRWPEGGPRLIWKAVRIGHGFSSVAIADEMIYTAGNMEGDTVITALGMSGSILWQTRSGPAFQSPTQVLAEPQPFLTARCIT